MYPHFPLSAPVTMVSETSDMYYFLLPGKVRPTLTSNVVLAVGPADRTGDKAVPLAADAGGGEGPAVAGGGGVNTGQVLLQLSGAAAGAVVEHELVGHGTLGS